MKKILFFNLLNQKEKNFFFPLCVIILFSSILEILSIGLLIPFFDLILKNKNYFYNNLLQSYINKFGYNNVIFYFTIFIFFLFTINLPCPNILVFLNINIFIKYTNKQKINKVINVINKLL